MMRLFLDTNVIIDGAGNPDTPQRKVLEWIGYEGHPINAKLILSSSLQLEIQRVARRVRNKDWAGEIIHELWQNCRIEYINIEPTDEDIAMWANRIPREDVKIYLTAVAGQTTHFVSSNHEFVQAIVRETDAFECYKPTEFVKRFIEIE